MIRLNSIVEGQTELRFFNRTLRPHLAAHGVMACARCVTTARKRHRVFRGGMVSYQAFKADLVRWLREDQHPDARFTTMIDLHHLPQDFPGHDEAAAQRDPYARAEKLEASLLEDIEDGRLIPYVQLHEFEALLFSRPAELARVFIKDAAAIAELEMIAAGFDSPELIDDGDDTAPSRRIIRLIPGYRKASAGPVVADAIGLSTIRGKCRHFDRWLAQLESLKALGSPSGGL